MKITLIVLLLIFILIGAYMIKSYYDFSFKDMDDTKNFLVKFGHWIIQVGSNVKDVTGYVIHKRWLPQFNETINATR
jgi:hypothetical protein